MPEDHKWTFWGFQSSDYRAAQLWLEEMADRGWELDRLPKAAYFSRARFHRVQRAGLRYLVDIPARKRFLEKEDRSDTQNYLRAQEGWELVGESGGLKVFKSAEGRIPARPHMEWEDSYWREALRPNLSTSLLCLAAVLVFLLGITSLFKGARATGLHQILLSNFALLYCALMAFFLVWSLWDMLHGIFYYLRCRRAVRLDEDPPVPGLLSARFRGAMASLAALLLLLSSVVSIFSGYGRGEFVGLADVSPRLLAADELGMGPFSGYYKEERSILIDHVEGYQWPDNDYGDLYQDRYDCRHPWVAGVVLSDLRRDGQPLAELTAPNLAFDAAYASPDGTRLLVLEGATVFSLEGPVDFTAPDILRLLRETLDQ